MHQLAELIALVLVSSPGFMLLLVPLRWLARRALAFEEL